MISRCKNNSYQKFRIITSRPGFTLVEVVIALFVFALLMLVFSGSISVSMRASRLNSQYIQATSLCQHKIDQLRAVGFGRIDYTNLRNYSGNAIIDSSPTTQPFSFVTEDKIADVLPSPTATITTSFLDTAKQIMKVTVTITWKNIASESATSTMSINAIIANVE
jgi:prepilin-type N-terminal cleavage/methylation domain-containing protein